MCSFAWHVRHRHKCVNTLITFRLSVAGPLITANSQTQMYLPRLACPNEAEVSFIVEAQAFVSVKRSFHPLRNLTPQ